MKIYKKSENIKNDIFTAKERYITKPFDAHKHDFFELEYILDGNGKYIIDGKAYEIKPGMIFFMTPVNFHTVITDNTRLVNIMFPGNLNDTGSLFRLIIKNPSSAYQFQDSDDTLVRCLLNEVVNASAKKEYSYAMPFLDCVLSKLSKNNDGETQSLAHIQKVIIYMFGNFAKHLSLEKAAKHVGLTPSYLSELFLKESGINFKEYLDNIRFDYARKLLRFSDITVQAVSLCSGFNDYANFTRRFKMKYGMTPKEYRNEVS